MNKKYPLICLFMTLVLVLLIGGLFLTEYIVCQQHIGQIIITQTLNPY